MRSNRSIQLLLLECISREEPRRRLTVSPENESNEEPCSRAEQLVRVEDRRDEEADDKDNCCA